MQKIDNIEIKNFKSIRHQKIEGCKRINVFIGYPNVGKSNILEALTLASSFRNSNRFLSLKDICRFEELIGLFNDGDKEKAIELKISDFVYTLTLFDDATIQYGIIHEERFLEGIINELNNFSKRLIIKSDGSISDLGTHADRPQPTINVKKYQFINLAANYKNNPKVLDFPFGGNLFEVIRYNSELRKECGELFNSYNLKLAFDPNGNLKIQKQLDEFSVLQLPIIQVADTLQRSIFDKAAIVTNRDSILLFEEPEAHMFPPYISKFTSDIMYDENNNQFFLTTHSPFVLNDFMENLKSDELTIYTVSYKKETGETIINRMSDEDIHEAYQFGYDFFMNIDKFISQVQHD